VRERGGALTRPDGGATGRRRDRAGWGSPLLPCADMTQPVALSTPPPLGAEPWATVRTVANLVTAVRTVVAVPVALVGLIQLSGRWLVAAYAVYWVGDVLDGWIARRLDQETRLGAVLDIISDRACSGVLVCGLVALHPRLWPALVVFLLQFMVLDCVLSMSFLRWPDLLGPNYFHRVDRLIWRLNWSAPAKSINTAGVVLAVVVGSLPITLAVALAQLAVKTWSARRVLRLLDGSRPR
jgi:phosphatidylglycerophosphate synthase